MRTKPGLAAGGSVTISALSWATALALVATPVLFGCAKPGQEAAAPPAPASAKAGVPASARDAAADDLLKRAAARLQGAKTYRADFVATDIYEQSLKDVEQRGTVSLARPEKWRIETTRYRRKSPAADWAPSGNDTQSVSDGKTHFFEFIHPYSSQVSRQPLNEPTLQTALGDVGSLTSFYLKDGADSLRPAGPARLAASTVWEGGKYQVVAVDLEPRPPATAAAAQFFIGQDLLVHRLLLQVTTPKGVVKKERSFRNIQLDQPVANSLFAFRAYPKAQPFLPSPSESTLLPEGRTAPDFTIHDINGRRVRLSDYRGKTVVLDFWASWCWACNNALPATAAVARRYRDKNVVVLAVVIWDTPVSFKTWLRKNHYPDLQFAIDPLPQGKDIATMLYYVSTRPTAYVIDRNGKIAGAVEGFNGKTTDLEAAIETALKVKTKVAG